MQARLDEEGPLIIGLEFFARQTANGLAGAARAAAR